MCAVGMGTSMAPETYVKRNAPAFWNDLFGEGCLVHARANESSAKPGSTVTRLLRTPYMPMGPPHHLGGTESRGTLFGGPLQGIRFYLGV